MTSLLPPSLNLATLLASPVPEDLTLGEVRSFIRSRPALRALAASRGLLRVRFLHRDGTEAPDTLTILDARTLAASGALRIVIDDGGSPAPTNLEALSGA